MLWLILVFFLVNRIFPYFRSPVPLGYDPGLYLYLFQKSAAIKFSLSTNLPEWMIENFEPGITVLGKILSQFIPPTKFLVPLLVFFQILLFFSLYFLAKKLWGQKAGLWSVFIFTCSALQYRFYWYYYLKNIAALSFLLLSFYFLVSGSFLAVPLAILVVFFHRQTGLVLLASLAMYFLFNHKQRQRTLLVFLATIIAAIVCYLPTFKTSILPLVKPVYQSFVPRFLNGTLGIGSGTFYNLGRSLLLTFPYLIFCLVGIYRLRKNQPETLVIFPFLLSFLLALLGVFGSRRFIPFADLFLVLLAGYGISSLKLKRKFTIFYIIFLIVFISLFVFKTGQPLILEDELREIEMLNETETDAYILVTDEAYMPWVYGWSNRKPIAPGFGEYDIYWTIPEWHQFWESNSREIEHQLLLKLPKPLYLFVGDRQIPLSVDFSGPCFEKINWRTYKFICEK